MGYLIILFNEEFFEIFPPCGVLVQNVSVVGPGLSLTYEGSSVGYDFGAEFSFWFFVVRLIGSLSLCEGGGVLFAVCLDLVMTWVVTL